MRRTRVTEPAVTPAARTTRAAREISLPRRRAGHTTAVTIGGERFYLTATAAADGTLGEVFIQWGKHGSGAAGLMELYASALSMALRHQVPLADLVRSGLGLRFAPAGHTDDPDIPRAHSVADYVSRRLALDWLPQS
jgi:ribonucleoside-diphosphate reductase alpha chain